MLQRSCLSVSNQGGRCGDVVEEESVLQAYHAEYDHPVEVEDVCYAQCEAEDYADYAGPVASISAAAHDYFRLRRRVPLAVDTCDRQGQPTAIS